MASDSLIAKAAKYCRTRGLRPNYEVVLGFGSDGTVWTVHDKPTALKVFDREESFNRELACYSILQREGVKKIRSFNVPEMLDFDSLLWVIEMTIVKPPYILDFGKAYCFKTRRHTRESLEDYEEMMAEHFSPNEIEEIELALARLKGYGIYYIDVRPGNINCLGLKISD